MRIRRVLVAAVTAAAICGCAGRRVASTPAQEQLIQVRADEVVQEHWVFEPKERPDGTAWLDFLFRYRSREDVAQMVGVGVSGRRSVEIMERGVVVARGWAAGLATGRLADGVELHGLMVDFNSITEAGKAAMALQEEAGKALDRHWADRSSWILPDSGMQSTARRLPSSGLPASLPKTYP